MKLKIFHIIGAASITTVLTIGASAGWFYQMNRPTGAPETTIEIKSGMSAARIGTVLAEAEIIRSGLFFRLVADYYGYDNRLKAGGHPVDGRYTTLEIARRLTMNPPSPPDIVVTVPEGLNRWETASLLARIAGIDSAGVIDVCADSVLIHELGIGNDTLEGYLYPDTYFVRVGATPREMVLRMVKRFRSVFTDSMAARAAELGFTVNEAVTLASLIETEVQKDEERGIVSQVFHRRLELGRPLEANPTIQYALGVRRRVFEEDLDVDSPYNTYMHRGLPPGPIASPGRLSLLAALDPADTRYLYFVADGSGGHVFSQSLQEHNRAVREYRQVRRQQRTP